MYFYNDARNFCNCTSNFFKRTHIKKILHAVFEIVQVLLL